MMARLHVNVRASPCVAAGYYTTLVAVWASGIVCALVHSDCFEAAQVSHPASRPTVDRGCFYLSACQGASCTALHCTLPIFIRI